MRWVNRQIRCLRVAFDAFLLFQKVADEPVNGVWLQLDADPDGDYEGFQVYTVVDLRT